MKPIQAIYIYAQIVFAILLMIFTAMNAIRCIIGDSGFIYSFLFWFMAYVAYRCMLISSIKELKQFKSNN